MRANRNLWLLTATALALAGTTGIARSQTVDYFATPWIVAPQFQPGFGNSPGQGSQTQSPPIANSQISSLYSRSFAAQNVPAPFLTFSTNAGIDEIATDNIRESAEQQQADLSSLLSLGETVSVNGVNLTGIVAATGVYRQNLHDNDFNQFTEYAFGVLHGTIVPDHLFLNFNGSIDDIPREGGGAQNVLTQPAETAHTYTIGATPVLAFRLGDLGENVLRYQIGEVWFSNNTQPLQIPGVNLGPISRETSQSVREDFRMSGTIWPRLMSDLSLSGTEQDAPDSPSGDLKRARGELISEYEVTRSFSLIGGAGYEDLHDQSVPLVDGHGTIWDIGGRLRPNADSYFLFIYGRHDRNSDFAGELAWRITPLTSLYAAYTDSLGTAQQGIINNSSGAVLGPDGALSGVTFDQSTVIGVLDDALLRGGLSADSSLIPLGIPVGTDDNLSPLQNGLFRTKSLVGSARTIAGGDPVVLDIYYQQNNSLTPFFSPSSTVRGGDVSWSRDFSTRLSGSATAGFSRITGAESGDIYNAALALAYVLSDSLTLGVRYDFARHAGSGDAADFNQNSLTLSLHKSFD